MVGDGLLELGELRIESGAVDVEIRQRGDDFVCFRLFGIAGINDVLATPR